MYKEQLVQPLFAYKNNIYKCTQINPPTLLNSKGGSLAFTIILTYSVWLFYLGTTLVLFIECCKIFNFR